MWGGPWGRGRRDRGIEDEARRRRQYDIDASNYRRAGLPPPTILDIPRVEGWEGEGESPYERYGRRVMNGFALPFDYDPGHDPWANRDGMDWWGGGRGGWWGGGMGRDRGRAGWGRGARRWQPRRQGPPMGRGFF